MLASLVTGSLHTEPKYSLNALRRAASKSAESMGKVHRPRQTRIACATEDVAEALESDDRRHPARFLFRREQFTNGLGWISRTQPAPGPAGICSRNATAPSPRCRAHRVSQSSRQWSRSGRRDPGNGELAEEGDHIALDRLARLRVMHLTPSDLLLGEPVCRNAAKRSIGRSCECGFLHSAMTGSRPSRRCDFTTPRAVRACSSETSGYAPIR